MDQYGNMFVDGTAYALQSNQDFGANLNFIYANDLPLSGGRIVIVPHTKGDCISFSTPIAFTTSGKYVLLQGAGSSGALGTKEITGTCLNFTPVAGSAITLDFATAIGSPVSSTFGLRDLTLVNNQCLTVAGCGSNAVGIDTGVENQGVYEGTFQNVSVDGFGIGWRDLNNNSVQIHWIHPQFSNNTIAWELEAITGVVVDGGQFAGNETCIRTHDSSATPEITLLGTQFFGNTANSGSIVNGSSLSSVSNTADISGVGVHLENSRAGPGTYISGNVDLRLFGGVVENDNLGTIPNFFDVSGQYIMTQGVEFACAGTCNSILTAETNVRGVLAGLDRSTGHFSNYVNGTNAAHISDWMFPGYADVPITPWTLESPLQFEGFDFADLGSPANGTITYCSDCAIANPCASGGTGALAKRLNSTWVCN